MKKGMRKRLVKHGDVLGINFSKEETEKYSLKYGDELDLDLAEILAKDKS